MIYFLFSVGIKLILLKPKDDSLELHVGLVQDLLHAALALLDDVHLLDQRLLHVVIDQVDALALLAVHQTLLRDVQRVGSVRQRLLAGALVLLQGFKECAVGVHVN